MSSLFFIICLSITITIDIIMINLSKVITDNTSYIISLSLISTSLTVTVITELLWLTNYKYLKRILAVNCYFIKNAIILFFVTAHYYLKTVDDYFGGIYFLNFIFSFLLFLSYKEDDVRIHPSIEQRELSSISVVQEPFQSNCCILYQSKACSICLEELLYKEYVHITTCNHIFHSQCLNKLSESNLKSCPNCRTKLID